jgi:hypothetical protein
MGLRSGIRDPGSGKNLFRIPDPGVKKAPVIAGRYIYIVAAKSGVGGGGVGRQLL